MPPLNPDELNELSSYLARLRARLPPDTDSVEYDETQQVVRFRLKTGGIRELPAHTLLKSLDSRHRD